jgi:hypothetical protein
MVYSDPMSIAEKTVRQSVSLPTRVARRVKSLAKSSGTSANRIIVDLIEFGIAVPSSNVTHFTPNVDRKPIAQAAKRNILVEELRNLDPRFRDPRCSKCGETAHLVITTEGVVVTCKKCAKIERVDTDTLQHLVDRLAATCFSCTNGKLKSTARPFGNILICQNCSSNNTWQGLSERIRR